MGALGDEPRGTLRLHVARAAESFQSGLLLAGVRDAIARGALVPVLEEYATPFPGFYLYYPQRRHASPALRALVEHLRRGRRI